MDNMRFGSSPLMDHDQIFILKWITPLRLPPVGRFIYRKQEMKWKLFKNQEFHFRNWIISPKTFRLWAFHPFTQTNTLCLSVWKQTEVTSTWQHESRRRREQTQSLWWTLVLSSCCFGWHRWPDRGTSASWCF